MFHVLLLLAALLSWVSPAEAQCTGVFPSGTACGNSGAGPSNPRSITATSWFDRAYCSTAGYLIVRLTGSWTCDNSIPLSVKWVGAAGNGVTNDTAAISTALVSGALNIFFPPGNYVMTGTCPSVATSGTRLIGAGRGASRITSTCTGHTINVSSGVSYLEVRDMFITRSGGAAVAGQDGIHCNTICDYALIDNVWIENHYNGFRLAGASFNKLTNSVANNNQNHGIHITNADSCAGLQWTLENNLTQQSNGDGVRIEAVTCDASVGEIINHSTFANKGNGLRVLGTAGTPFRLQGPRITGGFYGQDCDDEIYLDTYASTTQRIHGAFIELAGTASCGVNLGTAATNVGRGIAVTANNTFISIDHNILIQNSQNGIETSATFSQINNNNLRLNGVAAGVGQQSGIQVDAGAATIDGNVSQGNSLFGARILSDAVTADGNDFCNNTGGGIAAISIPTSNVGPTNKCAGIGVVTTPTGTLTLSNGLNSDIAQPTGVYSYLRISGPSAAFSIGGISSGVSGRVLILQNTTAQQMTIVNNDGSSGASNRIQTMSGANVVLAASTTNAILIYDGVAGLWTLVGTTPSATGTLNGAPFSTEAQALAALHQPLQYYSAQVDLNTVADTTFTITLPTGYTRYHLGAIRVTNTSNTASLNTAQVGVFSGTGGSGTAIVTGGASLAAVTTNAANTNAAFVQLTTAVGASAYFTFNPLYFRVTTGQGAAANQATVTVTIQILAVS